MVSRRCAALLFSLVAALNQVCESTYQLKTDDECAKVDTSVSSVLSHGNTEDPCYKFTVGDENKKEFYSPGYPGLYPNNTECFRVITAPPGYNIKLDFRDRFAIEPSEGCKNDVLEVRDGANGYNVLKEHPFCGYTFPPMIVSSDRHLWIHFKSDENIECGGFKAVYKFIPRTNPETPEKRPCMMELEGLDEGFPKRSDIDNETLDFNRKHEYPIDCVWKITVKHGWKIQLAINKFNLERPNDCESNFLDVFSNNTDLPSRDKNFCGSIAETVNSRGNVMFIRFYADKKANKSNFESIFTAYRDNDKDAECLPDEFNCDDAKCISEKLRCNGRKNCHFEWDEEDCDNNNSAPLSESHIIIIMVIFSLILSGMCFTFIFNCVKKLIRDHRTIKKYQRQSREHHLNELDKQESFEKKTAKLVSRSRSNSIQSSDSQRFAAAVNEMTHTSCYVPGGELLPIILRNEQHSLCANSNGDAYNQTMNPYDVENCPQPEMCHSACQTRESLFTAHAYSSTHSTPNHSIASTNSKPSPPAPFSTFGYRKEKYRAEAKIEMDAKVTPEERKRPYSVQTTKSAPDVIVTH